MLCNMNYSIELGFDDECKFVMLSGCYQSIYEFLKFLRFVSGEASKF